MGAILIAPHDVKLRILPVGLTDLCILIGTALTMTFALPNLGWRSLLQPAKRGCGPFLVCLLISLACSENPREGIKETIQILLYAVGGAYGFGALLSTNEGPGRLFMVTNLSIILAVGSLFIRLLHSPSEPMGPSGNGVVLFACLIVFSALQFSLQANASAQYKMFGSWPRWPAILLICLAAAMLSGTIKKELFPITQSKASVIPERLVEAYVALNVLSDRPLLGLGPGENYQTNIGAYYQGFSKENTIVPGTHVGLTVLIASLGLFGFATFFYWLSSLWDIPHLRPSIITLVLVGFFTPLFVARFLLALALLQGLAVQEGIPRD